MNYSDEAIRRQLRLGEDSHWEFKQVEFAGKRPRSPRRDDWADEIAAFANTNGGVLLCGVTDDGDVQGISREQMDELERLLSEVCSDSIHPPIRVAIFRKELSVGKPFLLIEVPEGYGQHDSPGGSFHRSGSSKRRMSSDERLRLAQRRGQARFLWFDKQTVPGTGFGTLDEDLWKPLLSIEGAADPQLVLEKMGLLAADENGTTRATVAGLLLCSKTPEQWLPNACITATCYRGTDRPPGNSTRRPSAGHSTARLRWRSPLLYVTCALQPARSRQGRTCPSTAGTPCLRPWLMPLSTAITRFAGAGSGWRCSRTASSFVLPAPFPII